MTITSLERERQLCEERLAAKERDCRKERELLRKLSAFIESLKEDTME